MISAAPRPCAERSPPAVVQQNDLAALFGIGFGRLRDHALDDLVRRRLAANRPDRPSGRRSNSPSFSATSIGAISCARGRFGVAEIRRPEQPCGAARQRLDQTLRRVQLHARHAIRRLAQIGVGEGVVAEIVPLGQHALHEPRMGRAVLADDEEGRVNALLLQDVEDFWRPLRRLGRRRRSARACPEASPPRRITKEAGIFA